MFIPIEWKIPRNEGYVNIDCYQEGKEGKLYFKPECCPESIIGCNLEACGCDPKFGIRVQVFDKYGTLLAEKEFSKEVSKIIVDHNDLGSVIIKSE